MPSTIYPTQRSQAHLGSMCKAVQICAKISKTAVLIPSQQPPQTPDAFMNTYTPPHPTSLSSSVSWAPSYLTNPALFPWSCRPCRAYIRPPIRLCFLGAEDASNSSPSQQSSIVPSPMRPEYAGGRRQGETDKWIAKRMDRWTYRWAARCM